MQLSVLAQAFFDGFGFTGLFSKAQPRRARVPLYPGPGGAAEADIW